MCLVICDGMARALVFSAVFVVALFDIVTGLRLMLSRTPYRAHGASGVWAERTPAAWSGETEILLRSLYRRIGAFSFHAGVVTVVWAWMARNDPRWLSALLVTYALTGLGFLINDWTFFRGTKYFVWKQVLGTLWTLALVGHFCTMR